ncbi:MAG TPA: ABC transporter substrate-binding protein, partial [Dehalococcoidia bacterium]|nr:ABC transporter substrate-binding protein [Dehalococcoidia bacterium]
GKVIFTVGPQGLELMEKAPQDNATLSSPIELATPIIIGWGKQIYTIQPTAGKRIGYIAQDDPLGRAMEEPNRKTAASVGGEFVGAIYFPIGTTDFSAFLTNMKALKPDILYTYGGAALLELTIQALQLDVSPILEIPGFIPALFPLLPPLGTHTIYAVDWRLPYTTGLMPPDPKVQQAVDSLGQLPGGLPRQTGFAISYHDYIYLLIQAMQKAGTVTDGKAIAAQMPGLTYEGPFGKVTMLPDRSTRGTMGLIQVTKDGFHVYVYANVGETKPILDFTAPPNAIAAPPPRQ